MSGKRGAKQRTRRASAVDRFFIIEIVLFYSLQKHIETAEPSIQAGTTAVVAYLKGNRSFVANAGDSRCVLGGRRADGSVRALRVTVDHKPSLPAEEARIKAAGGFVTRTRIKRGEISRVCAILGVARALGDPMLQPMVTCMPDVFDFKVDEHEVMILACDGLWDVVEDDEAMAVCYASENAGEAALRLRNLAFARNSDDNVSVLVVFFVDTL